MEDFISREGKAKLLPSTLRTGFLSMKADACERIEELRLREGQAPSVVEAGRESVPDFWQQHRVSAAEISWILETAGHGSVHTVLDQFRNGFLSVEGGHRIGLCGSLAMKGKEVLNFRRISSLALRFCHELPGISEPILPQLYEKGCLQSTLVFSPPGVGKTTLLRDLIRCVSDGVRGDALRVGVADERGELCGMYQGRPQRNVGRQTDIMDGCPKAISMLMLLRGMNPQVLVADEITAPEDVQAMEEVSGCGVTLLASAHGASPEEVSLRPVYRALLEKEIFRRFVWIRIEAGVRRYRVLSREEMKALCGRF